MKMRILLLCACVFASLTISQAQVRSCLEPAETSAMVDDIITIAVNIDPSPTGELLGSFTSSLNWDPSLLEYQGNGNLQAGFTGVVNDANATLGQLAFNGVKPTGEASQVTVLTIDFRVVSMTTDPTIQLNFTAMAAAFTFVDLLPSMDIKNALVMMPTSTNRLSDHQTARLYPPFLSPDQSQLTIRYAVPEIDQVSIRLFDLLGEQLAVEELMPNAAYQEFQWPTHRLSSGVYLLHLQFRNQLQVQKFFMP